MRYPSTTFAAAAAAAPAAIEIVCHLGCQQSFCLLSVIVHVSLLWVACLLFGESNVKCG